MRKPWLGLALAAFFAVAGACSTAELKQPPGSGTESIEPPCEVDCDTPAVEGGRSGADGGEAGVIPTSEAVTIQVQSPGAPVDVAAVIRAAKTSVHMTMYLLSDPNVIKALIELKVAGKDVKVILNKTFPLDGGDNATTFRRLTTGGVPVVYASPRYKFTHAKTIVIDGSSALIMTMNLTQNDTNREFVATDRDPSDIEDLEKIFAADYAGISVTIGGNLIVSPPGTGPLQPRSRLTNLIDSATKTLDVEVQSLSDDTLTDAIIEAHKQKVAVRVVISGSNEDSNAEKDSITKMKAAGVPLKALVTPYIHSKAVVVDGTKVFVGSHNFTQTALDQNREVGVVTDSAVEAAKVTAAIAKDFGDGKTP